jgi:Putative bacterial sensory transduction regulator
VTSAEIDRLIADVLTERELEFDRAAEGSYLVALPGEHKLSTAAWFVVGDHSLRIEAFVIRQPDENHAAFYRYMLEASGRMYGVHFTVDRPGDVYLVGRIPLGAVTADEIDRLLGCVLTYSDENFDRLLELGFAGSIRREWAWRESRGESLANLRAFERFAGPKATGRSEPQAGDR